MQNVPPEVLRLLRCPQTGQTLKLANGGLATADGAIHYALNGSGVPLLAEHFLSRDAKRQQTHYDQIAKAYDANLHYPHTQVYSAYLDRALLDVVRDDDLGMVLEVCCGRGEVGKLLPGRVKRAVGVDVSEQMLNCAVEDHAADPWTFLQGDATRLPLADASFDSVFVLGGVHHVPDRAKHFSEICRVLKPGGRFYFREPVSDFLPWRAMRAVIYRLSPMLEHETERPLLYQETEPPLREAGLSLVHWSTHGFLGFTVLMNSDVLVFNRAFRFIPGIRTVTRWATELDAATLRLPGLGRAGLQMVGVAEKAAA